MKKFVSFLNIILSALFLNIFILNSVKVHEIYQESQELRTISNFSISSSISLSPDEATINEAKRCPENLKRREICLQDFIKKLF